MEIMNEVTLFICSYFLFIFTGFVEPIEFKYEIGWYFVAIAVLNIFINWVAMMYKFGSPLIKIIKTKIKNCKKQKKEPT